MNGLHSGRFLHKHMRKVKVCQKIFFGENGFFSPIFKWASGFEATYVHMYVLECRLS
jgi:hypothetical protein